MSGFDLLCDHVSRKNEMDFMTVYDNLNNPISEDDMRILLRKSATYCLTHVVKFIAKQPGYNSIWLDEGVWRAILYVGDESMLQTLAKRTNGRHPEWISGIRFDAYLRSNDLESRVDKMVLL